MSGAAGAEVPVREALAWATAQIAAAGCRTPRLDAEVLLADVCGLSRARLLTDRGAALAGPRLERLHSAVERRARGREPVAYITGRRHFRHLELAVDRRALIPRPETELLVEVGRALPRRARVLDLGTGSGAVALALKHERPDLRVTGSDISAPALALAAENAARLGLEVRWLRADLLDGMPEAFDAVLCNPPYVADGELPRLEPEIRCHEPALALLAGVGGLDVIAALLVQLADGARAGARTRLVALEVGAGQAAAVRRLMRAAGLAPLASERDLAGIERVLVAEARAGAGPGGLRDGARGELPAAATGARSALAGLCA